MTVWNRSRGAHGRISSEPRGRAPGKTPPPASVPHGRESHAAESRRTERILAAHEGEDND